MKLSLFITFASMLLSCSSAQTDAVPSDTEIDFDLGISFPPVSGAPERNFTRPLLADLGVTKIRIGENWRFREAENGLFNWNPLDARIDWAAENNIDVLLTIQSNGPDWACSDTQNSNSCVFIDNERFRNYVETLLQRYHNKISKIQFGNEWMSNFWYIGTDQQFVAVNNIVYNAIQQFSPQTTFVLGGFTTISLRFLAGCDGLIDSFYDDEGNFYDRQFLDGNCASPEIQTVSQRIDFVLDNALFDEVDIHLYDDAENWKFYYRYMASRVEKPIIVTEFGGPNVNIEPDTETYQNERLRDYILAIDSLTIAEAYFFKLVEGTNNPAHAESGLINSPNLTKKMNYFTFKELNN